MNPLLQLLARMMSRRGMDPQSQRATRNSNLNMERAMTLVEGNDVPRTQYEKDFLGRYMDYQSRAARGENPTGVFHSMNEGPQVELVGSFLQPRTASYGDSRSQIIPDDVLKIHLIRAAMTPSMHSYNSPVGRAGAAQTRYATSHHNTRFSR